MSVDQHPVVAAIIAKHEGHHSDCAPFIIDELAAAGLLCTDTERSIILAADSMERWSLTDTLGESLERQRLFGAVRARRAEMESGAS